VTVNQQTAPAVQLPKGIMILGAAKSGTTALFYAIRNTLIKRHGLAVEGLFEPTETSKIKNYLATGSDRIPLVKMLLGPFIRNELGDFDAFDKKIIIYRDPRDNVISRLVYMLPKLIELSEKDKIEAVVKLFQQKEQAPGAISVVQIIKEVSRIAGAPVLLDNVRENALLPAKMKRESGDEYFMMPYDDFVDARFEGLNRYLGFDVDPEFEVDERHSYVVRTKSSGSWKNWFLAEDIDYFVKDVAADYQLLGFDVDQQVNVEQVIDPKSGSEYTVSLFARLRRKQRLVKKSRSKAARSGLTVEELEARRLVKRAKKKAARSAVVPTPEDLEAQRLARKAKKLASKAKKKAARSVVVQTPEELEAQRLARKAKKKTARTVVVQTPEELEAQRLARKAKKKAARPVVVPSPEELEAQRLAKKARKKAARTLSPVEP
jgi:hypothetical protein